MPSTATYNNYYYHGWYDRRWIDPRVSNINYALRKRRARRTTFFYAAVAVKIPVYNIINARENRCRAIATPLWPLVVFTGRR